MTSVADIVSSFGIITEN